jgi:hypothetical protein
VLSWDHCGIPDPMSGGGFTHPPAERVGPAFRCHLRHRGIAGPRPDGRTVAALASVAGQSPLTRRQLGNPCQAPGAALTGGFFMPVALLG